MQPTFRKIPSDARVSGALLTLLGCSGTERGGGRANGMTDLKRILRELTREIEKISDRNEVLERRLESITGALQGTLRNRTALAAKMSGSPRRTGSRRRGAPPKFTGAQAMELRRAYEKGATSAQLAKRYKAALPTILSTLRRAGTTLRRGRPSKSELRRRRRR